MPAAGNQKENSPQAQDSPQTLPIIDLTPSRPPLFTPQPATTPPDFRHTAALFAPTWYISEWIQEASTNSFLHPVQATLEAAPHGPNRDTSQATQTDGQSERGSMGDSSSCYASGRKTVPSFPKGCDDRTACATGRVSYRTHRQREIPALHLTIGFSRRINRACDYSTSRARTGAEYRVSLVYASRSFRRTNASYIQGYAVGFPLFLHR